ncbi:uncharacterized protein LOC124358054 isoform X2 [Homalodisca vitripennis]|uniref:uncharacterized protein LOC124358054 isoform X2 n=1 Tax=Homalodisca vitripennis TaxID=197043 RepID=UPI001EEBFB35|nr:uncharacterized protein LOC124358054 isoform X2 [Homalodisca vitripennis]
MVDFLFHEDYLYTVSVFASEAQILDSLPQYSSYVTQTVRERRLEPSSLPRFSQQETEDILDTLRLPPTRQAARQATQLYLSGHESLFTCVVRTLTSSGLDQEVAMRGAEVDQDVLSVGCSHQLWSQEMENLLLLAGVKLQHIRRMQHKWAQIIEEERMIVRQEEEAQRMEWERDIEQRVRVEVMEQLRERQSTVELREQGLTNLAEQLTAVHDDINDRLSQLQSQREELRAREEQQESDREQLEERLSQLQIREEQLESAVASFKDQVAVITSIDEREGEILNPEVESKTTREACVQVSSAEMQPVVAVHTQTTVAAEAVYTQTTVPAVTMCTQTVDCVDHEQQTSQGNDPDPHLLLQLQTDRQKINELQEENLELRAHSLQQRRRIDELTNRAASLSSQLEESQVAMALLSGRESGAVVTPTPPAPTFIAPTFGYNSPQRIGAGEESLFTSRPQQTTPRADGRKRPVRFAFSHNQNQTSEESSPTDEIIHNARARIQQLEEESAAVQRNYHAFQTRLMSSDSVMFPPLGSSLRTRNTPLRVRTSNVMPFLPFSNVPYPHNSVSYRSTFRPVVDEENEDSSSDQTSLYETGRIENVTNSRRLFTQRNMRQFERWKQFKKKFQRRDTLDQCRRNIRQSQSNTSSEDDEGDLRNARRRQELIKQSKLCTVQQTESHISDATEADNGQELDQIPAQLVSRNSKEENKSEAKVPTAMITEHYEQSSVPAEKVLVSNLESTVEDNLKLYADLEQSVKLIESVKLLLESQNVVNPTSTLSNGSLAVVESLPRDSQSGSQNGIAVSDNSSFPTVQRLFPRSRVEAVDKVNSEGDNVETVRTNQDRVSISEEISKTVINESVTVLPSRDEEQEDDVQENIPVPLSVPMLRLVSPGLSVANEDFIDTAAVTSSDIVEHESGDRGTTSLTSGSDILRELNPSKTESSDSVVSTGLADVSKLSSDFWD